MDVRARVLDQLRALSDSEIADKSSLITSRFFEMQGPGIPSWSGRKVALYRSLRQEVQLAELETQLLAQGAQLAYPRITDAKTCLMQFVQVDDPFHPESWEPGPYGGTEPGALYPVISPEEIELIVVPGLAFGRAGERIGRGKGYYDRYLATCSRALRLALCFDFQLFPSLQQNPWDQRVHRVVTEMSRLETGKS